MPTLVSYFEAPGDVASVVRKLKQRGFDDLTTYSPAPFAEIEEAEDASPSGVRVFTLVGGLTGVPSAVAYCSSKFAVRGMTKTAALELGPLGIRVNSVHPGGVNTPMITGETEGFDQEMASTRSQRSIYDSLPIGRVCQPEEIAQLVAFLASDESSYCTGSEFTADGGILAGV